MSSRDPLPDAAVETGAALQQSPEIAHTPELLWHWSPRANRASIEADGLTPGNVSNDGDWNPPHVCLARDAKAALALCHGKPPLDLWLVHRDDCTDLTRVDQEWRTTHAVRARQVDVAAHEGNLL